jgi:FkbM family methyltransferase
MMHKNPVHMMDELSVASLEPAVSPMSAAPDGRRFRPRVQALVRFGSAVARVIPLDAWLFREFLILGSDVFREYQFDFTFRTRRLNILWSARAFPELLTKHMLFHGLYQHDVLLWIMGYCRKGDIVFDVGAFHGLMSIVASKAVGREGKVVAFEPNPKAREHLLEHLDLNQCRNVRVESIGLMDCEGATDFYPQSGDVTWNSSFVREFVDASHKVESISVDCTRIDRYVQETGLVPSLIKIDTEGTELLVLKGAAATIEQHRPILVLEFNPESAARAGTSIAGLTSYLEDLSYSLKVIKPTKWGRYRIGNEEPFRAEIHTVGDLVNVICLPERSNHRSVRH